MNRSAGFGGSNWNAPTTAAAGRRQLIPHLVEQVRIMPGSARLGAGHLHPGPGCEWSAPILPSSSACARCTTRPGAKHVESVQGGIVADLVPIGG